MSVFVGALVVTTPQQMALEVTRRGVTMFRKLEVPVIGVVQNMGSMICSKCNHRNEMFGPAINSFAKELGIKTIHIARNIFNSIFYDSKNVHITIMSYFLNLWCNKLVVSYNNDGYINFAVLLTLLLIET